jgi:hypothetical protein
MLIVVKEKADLERSKSALCFYMSVKKVTCDGFSLFRIH